MSNKATKQVPTQSTRRASTPQPQSNKATKELPRTPVSKSRKHAALKGSPTGTVSPEQWDNVNRAIVQTVDLILSKNITLDGFGPDYWEMDEGLGIALVAEIRRAIKETCTLSDPKLQREISKMACDVMHEEFRFPYKGGGVWFRFKSKTGQTVSPLPALKYGY